MTPTNISFIAPFNVMFAESMTIALTLLRTAGASDLHDSQQQ